jgi:uridine phosphorylase
VATADAGLLNQIATDDMVRGITIACGGFYGPQGRRIRMEIQDPEQNAKVEAFRYRTCENGSLRELKICNFEMESSALAGLASILGHRAMTCCMVIANRYAQEMNTSYKNTIDNLISLVLERI